MPRFDKLVASAADWIEHHRVQANRRSAIRKLLKESDRLLDDMGYSRGVLEDMLTQREIEPLGEEALPESKPYLRTSKPARTSLSLDTACSCQA